jgi:hypothetical protein
MTGPQIYKSQCTNIRTMIKQGNMTPPKVTNLTLMDTNNSEVDETSDTELKIRMIRMSIKLKRTCINTWT